MGEMMEGIAAVAVGGVEGYEFPAEEMFDGVGVVVRSAIVVGWGRGAAIMSGVEVLGRVDARACSVSVMAEVELM